MESSTLPLNTISSPKSFRAIPTNSKSSKHPNPTKHSRWVKRDKYHSERTGTKSRKKSCTDASLSSSIKIHNSKNNSLPLVTGKSSNTQTKTVTGVMVLERDRIVSVSSSWNSEQNSIKMKRSEHNTKQS